MKSVQHKRGTAAIIAANNPVVPAGEFVIETDTGKGKVGDGSTAWASLPYAFPRHDGPLGTAAAPTFTFTSDPNTGMFSPGADQVALATGGVSRLSANATGVVAVPGSGTSFFQIDADGQIRIGNQAAVNTLRYVDIANSDTNSGSGAIMRLITQNTAGSGNTTADFVKYKNGAFYINNNEPSASGFIAFQVGGSEDVRITQAGFVGIGRSAPASALDVNGVITCSAGSVTAPAISFTGDSNTGIYSTGADTVNVATGGVVRLTVGSTGTVTTANDLTCSGVLRAQTALQSTGGRSLHRAVNEPYAVGSAYSATSGFVYFGAANESTTPDAQISGAGGGSLLYLQNAGNVGIGTTSPATKLEVNGQITVNAGTVTAPSIVSATGTADTGIYFPTTDNFAITTAGVNRLNVNATGRVGIGTGTTTPQALLGITQAVNFGTDYLSFGSGTVAYPTTPYSGTAGLVSKGSAADGRMMQQDGNGRLNDYWNAYTDVNTGNSWKYQVSSEAAGRRNMNVSGTTGFTHGFFGAPSGTAGGAITWSQIASLTSGTAGFVWLSPRGTSSDFYITAAGDVGVGTTSPGTKFAVTGTASVTGVFTVSAGTASAPAISPSGDTNTGVFYPAADTIAWATGGTERMRLGSAGEVQMASGTTLIPAGITEGVVAVGNTGNAVTLSVANGTVLTCTNNSTIVGPATVPALTITLPTAVAGKRFKLLMTVTATNSGGDPSLTFSGSVRWAGGSNPTISGWAGGSGVKPFYIYDFVSDGTYWFGTFTSYTIP